MTARLRSPGRPVSPSEVETMFAREVRQEFVSDHFARKAAYEASLREREADFAYEIAQLSGKPYGLILTAGCGCSIRVTG